ncbi:MAG: MMPL family transporter [Nocardia sp.]|nr:MMPL family transporter [Nocardia sp.]
MPDSDRRRGGETSVNRLAVWLRRLRWPVVVVWLLLIVVLYPLAGTLADATNNTASAYLPAGAQSTKVADLATAGTTGQTAESDPAIIVFSREGSLRPADQSVATAAHDAVSKLVNTHGITQPGTVTTSQDGQALMFEVDVSSTAATAGTVDQQAVEAIRAAVNSAVGDSGLRADITGAAGQTADSDASSQQDHLLVTAAVIVVVILLLVYRSPILWLLPLIGAGGAITVTKASVHMLANGAGLTVSSLSSSIMTVLIFGAATDYALLLIHRYSDELRRHERPEEAMAVTMRRTLPTLIASAATVTCAMLCLLASQSASLRGLGPIGAISIVVALLAQITLLPALLLVVGRVGFWPRTPRYGVPGRAASRFWSWIGRRVAVRPALTAAIVVVLLGGGCAGLAALRIDDDPVSNIPGNPSSVVGQRVLESHFGSGDLAPLTVLVPPEQPGAAGAALRGFTGIDAVTPGPAVSGYAGYSANLTLPPFGSQAAAVISDLRSRLATAAPGALVGGAPAIVADTAQTAHHDNLLIMPLVLVVILVIIALLLRAVVAPVVLVATTALSFAAAFGLSTLLWHYVFGFSGMTSVLPLYVFIFLVALGVDYNIFLADRIREESRTHGVHEGTLRGLSLTGGVITAAGIVLAGTFAALAQIRQVQLIEVGTTVALGVLLDTLLVRTVLVPATFLSLGERIWWPSKQRAAPAAASVGSDE